MVRLGTLVVTSLKPYRQRHSFQFRIYFFATLGLRAALAALAFANETSPRASARFIPAASQIRSDDRASQTGKSRTTPHRCDYPLRSRQTGSRVHRLASPQRRGSILGRREQRSLHFFRRCCLWMFRLPTHRRSDSRAPTGVIEEHQLLDRSWVHFAIFA
jgi:hypothetical protein